MQYLLEVLLQCLERTSRRNRSCQLDLELHSLKTLVDADLLHLTWYSFSYLRQILILRSL